MMRNRNGRYAFATLATLAAAALVPACASGPDDGLEDVSDTTPAAQRVATSEATLRIPTAFAARPDCAALEKMAQPPADLTIAGFIGCLSDASKSSLDAAYRRRVARVATGAPASLDAMVAAYGDRRIGEARLRGIVFNRVPQDVELDGVAPRVAMSASYGLDPATCTSSCLSAIINVVNGQRRIGYSPAWSSAGAAPVGWTRLLDEVNPGSFP